MTNLIKYKLKLDQRKNQKRKAGYPVVVFLFQSGKQKKINLGLFFELEDWNFDLNQPKKNKRLSIIIAKKKLLLDEICLDVISGKKYTLNEVKDLVLGGGKKNISSFYDFTESLTQDFVDAGKISNAKKYENAINQLKKFRYKLDFSEIDYNFLNDFKAWRLGLGNSKNTISTYLAVYKAIYNEAVRRKIIINNMPFDGVFKGIIVKSNRTKKRNISKSDILVLERAVGITNAEQRSVDLFLLLFYFGGQDLKDVYYLKKSLINSGRVYFQRVKLDEYGYQFDLKIVPKAEKIIDKYKVSGDYLFGWRKDYTGYKNFRDNFRADLISVQKKLNIKVLPLGGNLGVKVARHTFATIGKQLFIERELLRELMGHELADVGSIYEDRYPQVVRDEAHLKIIT